MPAQVKALRGMNCVSLPGGRVLAASPFQPGPLPHPHSPLSNCLPFTVTHRSKATQQRSLTLGECQGPELWVLWANLCVYFLHCSANRIPLWTDMSGEDSVGFLLLSGLDCDLQPQQGGPSPQHKGECSSHPLFQSCIVCPNLLTHLFNLSAFITVGLALY